MLPHAGHDNERSNSSMSDTTETTSRLREALAALVQAARNYEIPPDPEKLAALEALERAEIVPPACVLAPTFLPGVDYYMMRDAARNAVEYARHYRRLRAAQAALEEIETNAQLLLVESTYTGWDGKDAFEALEEAKAQRAAFRRE
jgi:hypothetical protein